MNLPNLEHLTMMNMRYFRCEWLSNIPSEINLHTNMCASYLISEINSVTYMTTTGEYILI